MLKNMKHRRYDNVCWRPALRESGESVKLILEIDRMDLLDWLGNRALRSKGGKSQIASGAIRVRVEKK